ncbi:MAG: NADH-quinone oxidoreductase subunit NuoE [Calditrichia bacterium]
MPQVDLSPRATKIKEIAEKYNKNRDKLMLIFHDMVDEFKQLEYDDLRELSRAMEIQPTDLFSVASFYSFLPLETKGKYKIRLCQTVSCDFAGKKEVASALTSILGIDFGETSKDGKWSLEFTNCMGFCDQGPAMLVNDQVFTQLTPEKVKEIISKFE